MSQANNTIMLIGRIGSDINSKTINDKNMCSFSLAVNRTQKDNQGNYITDWFNVEFWNKQSEILQEYTKKGSQISVLGSIQIQKWEKDGQKQTAIKVIGSSFQLLDSKKENNFSNTNTKPVNDFKQIDEFEDDIPPF